MTRESNTIMDQNQNTDAKESEAIRNETVATYSEYLNNALGDSTSDHSKALILTVLKVIAGRRDLKKALAELPRTDTTLLPMTRQLYREGSIHTSRLVGGFTVDPSDPHRPPLDRGRARLTKNGSSRLHKRSPYTRHTQSMYRKSLIWMFCFIIWRMDKVRMNKISQTCGMA